MTQAGQGSTAAGRAEPGDARPPRWIAPLAWLWLALVILLGASVPYRLQATGGFDTSLLSLLPKAQQDAEVSAAVERISGTASRKLLLLVGHADFEVAARASDAAARELRRAGSWLNVMPTVPEASVEQATDFVRNFRYGLLTAEDRASLVRGDDLAERALSELYQPVSPPRFFSLEEDPLGLSSRWLLSRAAELGVSLRDGRLVVEREGKTWILLSAELGSDAMSFSAQQALAPVLEQAATAARGVTGTEVLRSGFIFHAAEAATRANREMSTIGIGSLLGVMLLMILPFGSPKPMLLVVLPVAVGTLVALAVNLWAFDRVHLITMVFGASIVGVAEDYGVHFVCGALGPGRFSSWLYLRHIFRGLVVALITTLAGYLALAVLPFPGLRQMGLFGATGLLAGWISAMLWLPFLGKNLGKARFPGLIPRLVRLEARWPRFQSQRWLAPLLLATFAFAALGLAKANVSDNVRALYDSVPELGREDERVRNLLRVPAGGQFFVVRASNSEQLLQREESLIDLLRREQSANELTGWQALADQVPSAKRQAEQRALLARAYAPGEQVERLFARLEDDEALGRARSALGAAGQALTLEQWLASPLSAPTRQLWLGTAQKPATAVLLRGTLSPAELGALRRESATLPGVTLVDQVADVSQVLAGFRQALSWLLPIGYVAVALCLTFVYGRRAWRVTGPAAFASVLALGLPAWFGQPVTLFDLLALVLVLGMGVDYGIFVNEDRATGFGVAFLSVTLGAASTLLSFGLLAASGTPALSDFGLTLLIGIGVSWLLTPCFAKFPQALPVPNPDSSEVAHAK